MYTIKCPNCKGKGHLPQFSHVEGGICFSCNGSGYKEVDKETYDEYQKQARFKELVKYIIFDNGNVKVSGSIKAIEKTYGNFYCGTYADIPCQVSYKDKNVCYINLTDDYEEIVNKFKTEYKRRQQEQIKKEIAICKEILKDQTEPPFIQKINDRIRVLESQLT